LNKDEVLNVLPDPRVRATLSRLHALADAGESALKLRFAPYMPRLLMGKTLPWETLERRFDDDFISIGRHQGVYCYMLARALGARHIVEFGTSFGISTIYLACAVRDNGGGRVIGTERVAAKAQRARAHLEEAGLSEWVEIREGEAPASLAELPEPVDFLLNDGFPAYALPVLQAVAPKMRAGAVVVSDNAALFPADHRDYVEWVRNPANGFLSTRLALDEGTEFSVRVR
jgi:predicted O-methyltransferase YrrM